jgi:trehalose 6-phosphate synthase
MDAMKRILASALPLLVVLGLMAWVAYVFVDRTTHRWFTRDVGLRARLAVHGTHGALVQSLAAGNHRQTLRILESITRDERIMGAAACGPDATLLVRTDGFPAALTCASVRAQAASDTVDASAEEQVPAGFDLLLGGGRVHVSAIPIAGRELTLGQVVLLHDMSFADRRAALTRRFTLMAFALVSLAAALATVLIRRVSWHSWTAELRNFLRGSTAPREFQPFMSDVRELVARLAAESDTEGGSGAWTPERLRRTLKGRLGGERVVILANREPYVHERMPDGGSRVMHPASGLVTALEPVMRACSGVWIAHGSGSADRETADRRGRLRVPPGEESYWLRRVWLSPEEEQGYYYGFANEGLWPLCHMAHVRPVFRSADWAQYSAVNAKFASVVTEEVDSTDPIVLLQDYHLALAPRLLRELLPHATTLMFWHVPWPNSERFGICPWTKELLEGMLGSNILGFHTQADCNNFLGAADRYLEARIDRELRAIVLRGHTTFVRAYPISIDWPNRWLAAAPPAPECRAGVVQELGLAADALIGLGVDRLDYTKGVEERFLAVERLLERFPSFNGRFTFVQLAAPSRTAIDRYRELNEAVERLAARINGRFGRPGYRPIILLRQHHEPQTVFKYYRAADVCYVSSLHDGMNLVAKEFIAARDDDRGVLVLSSFTGAARELTEALIVNPYDLEQASLALATALNMTPEEQRERMRAMRRLIGEFNVYRWAGRMLVDAARVQQRGRLSIRLVDHSRSLDGVP